MSIASEDIASAFAGLPGFSPLMNFNLSGTEATTRLLQLRMFGLYQCDISRKFDKHPSEAPDLHREDFLHDARWLRRCKSTWTLIRDAGLDADSLYRGEASDQMDMGHMVWTEPTLSRFLLVNLYGEPACACGNPYHNDYMAAIKYQSQRFLNLLTYLQGSKGSRPKWVRATYITDDQKEWDPRFLTQKDTPVSNASPPIIHLTPSDLLPSLRTEDLEAIDNILARDRSYRTLVRPEDKAAVHSDTVKRNVPSMIRTPNLNEDCGGCGKSSPRESLKKCSRCKLAFYCNADCQRVHWPKHKAMCRSAS